MIATPTVSALGLRAMCRDHSAQQLPRPSARAGLFGVVGPLGGYFHCFLAPHRGRRAPRGGFSSLPARWADCSRLSSQSLRGSLTRSRTRGANESGCAVVGDLPTAVVTAGSRCAVLVEAGRQLGLAFARAEDLFAKLSVQLRTP